MRLSNAMPMTPRLLDLFCGAGGCTKGYQRQMEIDWMGQKELAQAIPPAYTEFIGRQLMEQICR